MIKYVLLGLGLVFFGLGLLISSPETNRAIASGYCKALGGVFIILYFLKMLFANEPVDEAKHH